jgi:hypothetical protein
MIGRRVRHLVLVGALLAAACGLDLVGGSKTESPPVPEDPDGSTVLVPFDAAVNGRPDAGASPASCEGACEDAGGSCDSGVCAINCTGATCKGVTCPPGVPCNVTCRGTSCIQGVDCGRSTDCVVSCAQGGACGTVTCTGGAAPGSPAATQRCRIECQAGAACGGTIVANAQTTEIECTAGSACKDVTCGGGSCKVTCKDGSSCGTIKCCADTCTGSATKSATCL